MYYNKVNKLKPKIIVISDIHLGSDTCKSKELLNFLSIIQPEYLILNGDVFDDLKFNRLKSSHWKVLGKIRKLSKKLKLIWIRGNHDTLSSETLSHLLGIDVKDSFLLKLENLKIYFSHGDKWDIFIYKYRRLSHLFTIMHQIIQKFFPKFTENLTNWLIKKAKFMNRNSIAIEYSAFDYAKREKINIIICGHTHLPLLKKENNIIYGNDGAWQGCIPHFIMIDNNNIFLCNFNNNKVNIENSFDII